MKGFVAVRKCRAPATFENRYESYRIKGLDRTSVSNLQSTTERDDRTLERRWRQEANTVSSD